MEKLLESKWLGRKYTLTLSVIAVTTGLAYFSKMNGDVAMVFSAAIASLNYALRDTG